MDKKLLVQALTKFFAGLFLVAVLVFLPAGTLDYWHGWLFLGVLFFPMTVLGIVLLVKSPELLRKRLQTKEKEGAQKKVVALSGLMFVVGFLLCGLNVRFGWFLLPKWAALFASAVFLLKRMIAITTPSATITPIRTNSMKIVKKLTKLFTAMPSSVS